MSGEDEPRVLQEIFSSLLSLAPTPEPPEEDDDTVAFIARFLNSKDADVISVATIALGSSRRLAAFNALRDFAEITFEPSKKRMAFEAIALVRLPEAFDYMIDMIQRGSKTEATLAEESLSIYQGDVGLWNRIQSAKTGTSDDLNSFLDSLL